VICVHIHFLVNAEGVKYDCSVAFPFAGAGGGMEDMLKGMGGAGGGGFEDMSDDEEETGANRAGDDDDLPGMEPVPQQ
jgi:hypothetical protein